MLSIPQEWVLAAVGGTLGLIWHEIYRMRNKMHELSKHMARLSAHVEDKIGFMPLDQDGKI